MSIFVDRAKREAKRWAKRFRSSVQCFLLGYPKNVECTLCGWEGRRFISDGYHPKTACPNCRASIRHRLPLAALKNIDQVSYDRIIRDKRVLHFAPEEFLTPLVRKWAATYVTADFLRTTTDLKVDMCDMAGIENESFDVVIAFDVLEHVPDYQKALQEVHRVLSPGGYAIFTVPQKDNLLMTFEDPSIVTEKDRLKYYGQCDHLRIFGEDFADVVESKGFVVRPIDESNFSEDQQRRNVLSPPAPSKHPLATNHRKAFFCRRLSTA